MLYHCCSSSRTCSPPRWRSARSSPPTCGCCRSWRRTARGSRRRTSSSPASSSSPSSSSTRPAPRSSGRALLERPDYLANPKLQAKLALVVLLTINAFVLHRLTFPRLARGRRVAAGIASDWIAIGIPVGVSNFLWMFVAFLGVARAWNGTMAFGDVMAIAAIGYGVAQGAVFAILAVAASGADPVANPRAAFVRRRLASLGNLGRPLGGDDDQTSLRH